MPYPNKTHQRTGKYFKCKKNDFDYIVYGKKRV